ncbi:MAG: NnrU family protein [Pseudomonadota bacterium]|jgi:uncharacterized membrane protein
MTALATAALVFVLLHLLISGTPLRQAIVRVVTEPGFSVLFSIASLASLVWLGFAFKDARGSAADHAFWGPTTLTREIALGLQAIAFLFIVPGLTTPTPTAVGQLAVLDRFEPARGMIRITRHPFLWGVTLWAIAHLLVQGKLSDVLLFGTLLLVAVVGTFSIDAKRRRQLGDKWLVFQDRTSNVPFAAILAGRQSLRLAEIDWWRILAAVVVYIGVATVHGGVVFGGL